MPGTVVAAAPRPTVWRVGVGLLLSPYRAWLDGGIPPVEPSQGESPA